MPQADSDQHLKPMTEVLPAAVTQQAAGEWALSGTWTARGLGTVAQQLDQMVIGAGRAILRGQKLDGLDSAGAWVLQRWLHRQSATVELQGWAPRLQRLMEMVAERITTRLAPSPKRLLLERVGRSASAVLEQVFAMLTFTGETAAAAARQLVHPGQIRWRAMLRNIQIGGFDALPIIGLTSFLLGVVVAYQGADQLKNYGANIFVVDLVGYAMLREFAPLITAIIIAGRSGSAYTAEIGAMVITEEVDALRTIDIDPIDLLVLPKVAALVVALPFLTVFADITGVFGGMVMARSQLGIGFHEFIDRFGREMHAATLLVGIGKSVVFAFIISGIGCFQGFRTKGSADSVGRQTTMSVVQSIFLLIVADALFSVVFSMLDI